MTDLEIWNAVKQLQGKTITTISEGRPNHILEVEDTITDNDGILIKDRETKPKKSQIVQAYKTLYIKGSLERAKDLRNIAGVNKQVSSIVFAIVYEIAKKDVELVEKGRIIDIVLKTTYN